MQCKLLHAKASHVFSAENIGVFEILKFEILSSSSSDFWLTCRYRGHIHNSRPPSRQLACCTHGRSHTRSPGVSTMRVDSWELPLSATPLCQLLPSHLGPPRPTLSINLYIKGCLDCTVGALHVSIPAEPSLTFNETLTNDVVSFWTTSPVVWDKTLILRYEEWTVFLNNGTQN